MKRRWLNKIDPSKDFEGWKHREDVINRTEAVIFLVLVIAFICFMTWEIY